MTLKEIDLATGKFKEVKPLKDALDYRKWDQLANRVTEHDGEEDEIAEYWWSECAHEEIRVRIPVWGKTKSKQCRVDFKLNWITVYAPPTEAIKGFYTDDAPPKEPLLDFQLYGAVDVDECTWEIVDDGAVRNIIVSLHKSPVYKWPTLHRVNGLKSEKERKPKLAAQKKQWDEEAAVRRAPRDAARAARASPRAAARAPAAPPRRERRLPRARDRQAQAKAQKDQGVSSYTDAAGPKKPPAYGPAERPERRPHRPKNPDGTPLPPSRPPGSYERGRIIVSEPPDYTDSSSDEE